MVARAEAPPAAVRHPSGLYAAAGAGGVCRARVAGGRRREGVPYFHSLPAVRRVGPRVMLDGRGMLHGRAMLDGRAMLKGKRC